MTAPRNCRYCGAALPPSVRWCLQCHARVRELSPRPRTEGTYVGPLQPEVRYSRWRAGPLTFGPAGRIAITVVVVLFGSSIVLGGFNPASLWFLSGYVTAATLILKQTWTNVKVPASDVASASHSESKASTCACEMFWAGELRRTLRRPARACAPPAWRTSASISSSGYPGRRRATCSVSWPKSPVCSRIM